MNVLHIYAQEAWHADAYIVGDRAALLRLSEAIDVALNTGRAVCGDISVADGEGFEVRIACESEATVSGLRMPYAWEVAAHDERPLKSPSSLFGEVTQ